MNCTEAEARLHAYVDNELSAAERRSVEAHLRDCAGCRRKVDALRALLVGAASLRKEIPPGRDLWESIATDLTETAPANDRRPFWSRFIPLATAAAVVFAISIAEQSAAARRASTWAVTALAGSPRLGATALRNDARFEVGQWLETDGSSRARISVGALGEVTVDPNSRLRLTGTAATDHRLELARGTLQALIWAPPRIFYVDTPSATAVDLGCAYTLAVDDHGNSELKVTLGYVALEHGERESIIPAGAICLTRQGSGPGTPFAADASPELRVALERFDFEPTGAESALARILAVARSTDAVTLWHLLARTEGTAREAVFDVLARHHALPNGVTRSGILAGDAAMRRAWGTELGLGASFSRR